MSLTRARATKRARTSRPIDSLSCGLIGALDSNFRIFPFDFVGKRRYLGVEVDDVLEMSEQTDV
ncbi:hypothetical protein ACN22W_35295 [Burkholderia theae]|uniref:hypothetical protein n=1 Tax=Burkholderia theae TaxID=3143496 RepID=UPI003AFB50B0